MLVDRYLFESIAAAVLLYTSHVGTENCYQFTRDVKNIPCMKLLVLSGVGMN